MQFNYVNVYIYKKLESGKMGSIILCIIIQLFLTCTQLEVNSFDNYSILIDHIKTLRPSELTIVHKNDLNNNYYNFIYTLTLPKVIINLKYNSSILNLPKNSTYIIIVDDYENFNNTINCIISQKFSNRNHYILLVKKIRQHEIRASFQLLWHYNIYKVAIYLKNSFITWYPFNIENNCGNKIVLIETIKPFPWNIPKKWHNCTIRVITSKTSHVIKNPYNTTDPGSFILFTNIIIKAMAANVVYVKINEDYIENYTKTLKWDSLKEIMYEQNGNLGYYFGTINIVDYKVVDKHDFEDTYDFGQHKLVVIVPKVALLYKSSIRFSTSVLIVLLIVAICVILFWKISMKITFSKAIFMYIQMTLQNNLQTIPKIISFKLLFAILLFYFIFINCLLQTQLSSNLTTQKMRKLRRILDASDAGVPFVAPKLYFFHEVFRLIDEKLKRTTTITNTLEMIEELVKTQDYAIIASKEHLSYIKNPNALVILDDDPLMSNMHRFIVPFGYPLLDTINFWTINLIENGIMEKCMFDSERFLQQMAFNVPYMDVRKVTLTDTHNIFICLIYGLCISMIIFVIEILSYSYIV